MNLIYRSLIVFMLLSITGCATRLNEPQMSIDGRFQIEDARYNKDRTMLLTDIAPIIDAYVKYPFPKCSVKEITAVSERGTLNADLSKPFSERVYHLEEDKLCVW